MLAQVGLVPADVRGQPGGGVGPAARNGGVSTIRGRGADEERAVATARGGRAGDRQLGRGRRRDEHLARLGLALARDNLGGQRAGDHEVARVLTRQEEVRVARRDADRHRQAPHRRGRPGHTDRGECLLHPDRRRGAVGLVPGAGEHREERVAAELEDLAALGADRVAHRHEHGGDRVGERLGAHPPRRARRSPIAVNPETSPNTYVASSSRQARSGSESSQIRWVGAR